MPDSRGFVIVGAGLTGASAAKAVREAGFDGPVTILGAEAYRPYIRPPLSKELLQGAADRESVFVESAEWYPDNRIELRQEFTAVSVDPADHTVSLSDGSALPYDRLLLATGSSPRLLATPGADLGGVHYLRTLDNSEALHEQLESGGKRLVVIGSGWIGMEVAASARMLGNEVTILERGPIPLANALGDELGRVFADLHTQNGVDLRASVTVEEVVGEDGQATGVRLAGGEIVPADLVLAGIGAVPNLELAASAGLEIDNGVLVDASLRTSDPDIFAAGDIANALHPVINLRIRSEHWANALNGGAAAGKAMLGLDVSYDDIPYFYTDQFDLGMEYSGYAPLARGAEVVVRGDIEAREFISFWVADGVVVAGMNVNIWDVNEEIQGVIRRANRVDPARLADASVPLEEL